MMDEETEQSSDLVSRLRGLADEERTKVEYGSETGFQRGLKGSRGLLPSQVNQPSAGVFGEYRLTGRLRVRGNTTLYLASHPTMSACVIVKVFDRVWEPTLEACERFERESEALSRIDHPRIVRFIDGQLSAQHAFLVMEKIDGCDLAELVEQHGPLSCQTVRRIGFQIAEALTAVEQAGLVHRDVKPSNVMLTRSGDVKLIDFGIAKRTRTSDTTLTRQDQILGTIDFMAPEQVLDASVADIRSDLYGLGCTLFFLLTGRKPFELEQGGNTIRTAIAQVSTPLPSLSKMRPEIEPDLIDLVENLCEKDPQQRISSPSDVSARLTGDDDQFDIVASDVLTSIVNVANTRTIELITPEVVDLAKDPDGGGSLTRSTTVFWFTSFLMLTITTAAVWYYRSKDQVITNSIGMKLIRVPAGEFTMGSLASAEDLRKRFPWHKDDFKQTQPPHTVKISKPFFVGQTEVTQGQWLAVMGDQDRWIGLERKDVAIGKDYPASSVSWHDANEFCRRLSEIENRRYRLPTEAEWEYFAKAGTQTIHSYGDAFEPKYGWTQETTETTDFRAREVALQLPNPWGLYDTYGNVFEWCSDWYDQDYYQTSTGVDPAGKTTGTERVLRGGCYVFNHFTANSVVRWHHNPDDNWTLYGFRVVLEVEPKE